MRKLSDLPNIGKTMEKRLAAVDILDVETLVKIGSKQHGEASYITQILENLEYDKDELKTDYSENWLFYI